MVMINGIKKITKVSEMQEFSRQMRREGKTLGFVPTMGALHEGHLSLVRKSAEENDVTVVSIFVNPTQFGPGEDFEKYPRNLAKDTDLVAKAGATAVFCPATEEMYPADFAACVEIGGGITDKLCGISRPGHFRGVTTIVTKLFWAVLPDNAYFGQKDAQQALIIQKMIRDLNMPIRLSIQPTVRESDGLAMSSRNAYLSPDARKRAVCLKQALDAAKSLIDGGEQNAMLVLEEMADIIDKNNGEADYIAIVRLRDLEDVEVIKGDIMIALAVYIDGTRLIDNMIFFNL
jgi:pantoate--beta-alanine ligase